jgi:hypothetical protein
LQQQENLLPEELTLLEQYCFREALSDKGDWERKYSPPEVYLHREPNLPFCVRFNWLKRLIKKQQNKVLLPSQMTRRGLDGARCLYGQWLHLCPQNARQTGTSLRAAADGIRRHQLKWSFVWRTWVLCCILRQTLGCILYRCFGSQIPRPLVMHYLQIPPSALFRCSNSVQYKRLLRSLTNRMSKACHHVEFWLLESCGGVGRMVEYLKDVLIVFQRLLKSASSEKRTNLYNDTSWKKTQP